MPGATRRYPAVSGATRRYPALPGGTRRYLAVSGASVVVLDPFWGQNYHGNLGLLENPRRLDVHPPPAGRDPPPAGRPKI